MLSYGLLGPSGYLRDAWCQLDFIVVSLAWLPILLPSMGNMSAIRGVRALRPLRALKRVPGMPVLVTSILKSMPALGDVAMLAAFVFFVFGIIGMNLFRGVLRERCTDPALLAEAEAAAVEGVRRALRGGSGGGAGNEVARCPRASAPSLPLAPLASAMAHPRSLPHPPPRHPRDLTTDADAGRSSASRRRPASLTHAVAGRS